MTFFSPTWLKARLSRVTASGDFIPEIDGLRFAAIATVILHHVMAIYLQDSRRFGAVSVPRDWRRLSTEEPLINVMWQGYFGVQLFFVISGIVLALPFARHHLNGTPKPSIGNYFLRRVTRIEPPYVINILVCFVLHWITFGVNFETYEHLGASLLYVHNLIYSKASLLNGVAWSLEIEVQFYILAPLFAIVFAIRSHLLRRAVIMGVMLACGAFVQFWLWATPYQNLKISLLGYMQYFLGGFLLADLYASKVLRTRASLLWDAAGIGAALLLLWAMMFTQHRYYWLTPFPIVLFYVGTFQGNLLRRCFTWWPVTVTGGMCYTIYLFHVPVINLTKQYTLLLASPSLPFWLDWAIQVAVMGSLILIVCSVLFVYTEKPFMGKQNWLRRFADRTLSRFQPAVPARAYNDVST